MITLNQAVCIMKSIKENNPEIEIIVDSKNGIPHFVLIEKVIYMKGGENGYGNRRNN